MKINTRIEIKFRPVIDYSLQFVCTVNVFLIRLYVCFVGGGWLVDAIEQHRF